MTTTSNPEPGVSQAVPFTPAEITDIRRFAGFPAYAAFGYIFGAAGMANLDLQIAQMSDQEQTVIRTIYLTNLTALEAAVLTAGTNMGTDIAAVWTRNKNETSDRQRLFDMKRRDMCAFIGIAPGPGLQNGNRTIRC